MDPSAPKPRRTLEELLESALQLPREDRLRIAERLFESAKDEKDDWPAGLHPAWRDELASRLDKLDRGEAVLHDQDDVMREALARRGSTDTTENRRSSGMPPPSRGQGLDAERDAVARRTTELAATDDAARYAATPVGPGEFSSDHDSLAWESDGWERDPDGARRA